MIWQGFREEFSACSYKMETVVELLHLTKVSGGGFGISNRKALVLCSAGSLNFDLSLHKLLM